MTQITPSNNTEVKIDTKSTQDGGGITVIIKSETEKQQTEKEKILKFLEQMADFLTIRHVALLSVLTFVLMIIWATYEQRHHIFSHVMSNIMTVQKAPTWALSDKSKILTQNLTSIEAVGGVMITDMILKRNVRITKYYYVRDPSLAKHFASLEVRYQGPMSIFNKNQNNTERMLAILNHEYVCINTENSVFVSIPRLVESFPVMCSVSIPAQPGELAGYITIALVRQVSEEEMSSIRLAVITTVNEIYRRDIEQMPEPKPFSPKGARP